jgi:hypothetical protein
MAPEDEMVAAARLWKMDMIDAMIDDQSLPGVR